MTEVRVVYVQLKPDQVTEGYYTVDGDKLVMTFADGSPVDADRFCHTLKDGESAKQIAGRLTRQVRKSLLGDLVDGFNDPIRYADMGIA